jgi:type VI secretion system secreted protein VgrG
MGYNWSFSTSATGQDANKFRMLAFTGEDSVCQGYTFDLLLVADVTADNAPTFLKNMAGAATHTLQCSYTYGTTGFTFVWLGMPERVEWMFTATKGGSVMRVLLRPHSFKLRLGVHSRIFLGANLPTLLGNLLVKEGFTATTDFTTSGLRQTYYARPISCQYNESSFDFLLRHLERVGGYSYIEQVPATQGTPATDRLVLADGAATAVALPNQSELAWDVTRRLPTVVYTLSSSMAASATSVTLRDYSTEKPGSESQTSTPGTQQNPALWGGGTANWYGAFNMFGETDLNSYSSGTAQAQAQLMAQARAKALVSQSNRLRGESTVAWMRAGYYFTLSGTKYQLLTVRHVCSCSQLEEDRTDVARAAGLGFTFDVTTDGYNNSFVCHPLALGSFAPEISVSRPVVSGLAHATVYSADTAGYALLDSQGRYNVQFPFAEAVYDANNNPVTSGVSVPLRAMQIHAGAASGIHFPLLNGAEVLVAFTDGDPDRPVILGALPNTANLSVVTSANNKENVLKTQQGHSLVITDDAANNSRQIALTSAKGHNLLMTDDTPKREIRLSTSDQKNFIRIVEAKNR